MDIFSPANDRALGSSMMTAYVGNLRSDIYIEEIEKLIQSLFGSIGVRLLLQDIRVHRRSTKKPAYGFVVLKDKAMFDYVLAKLNGVASEESSRLVYPGESLVISAAHRNRASFEKTESMKCNKPRTHHPKKSRHKNTDNKMNKGARQPVAMETNSFATQTNVVAVETSWQSNPGNLDNVVKVDASERHFYVGQRLSTEDRLTEYKKGGGNYLDTHFKIHVGNYVCAFLNSQGGSLLVGVKDDCSVCGVQISNHREDQLRLDVDRIMKGFNPPVFPNSYTVKFIPVYSFPVTHEDHPTQESTSMNTGVESNSKCAVSTNDKPRPTLNDNVLQLSPTCVPKLPTLSPNLSSKTAAPSSNNAQQDNHSLLNGVLPIEKLSIADRGIVTMIKSDLKVIEITVHPPACQKGDPMALYENNKGEVYIRRDGSIQGPLKASQILAWSKQNISDSYHLERNHLEKEVERKQGEIEMNLKLVQELVKQKQFLEDQYQEKIEKLQDNETKLNTEIDVLKSQEDRIQGELEQMKRTKSKVCVLL